MELRQRARGEDAQEERRGSTSNRLAEESKTPVWCYLLNNRAPCKLSYRKPETSQQSLLQKLPGDVHSLCNLVHYWNHWPLKAKTHIDTEISNPWTFVTGSKQHSNTYSEDNKELGTWKGKQLSSATYKTKNRTTWPRIQARIALMFQWPKSKAE